MHAFFSSYVSYVTVCQTLMKEWGYDADQADVIYNFIDLIFHWSARNQKIEQVPYTKINYK